MGDQSRKHGKAAVPKCGGASRDGRPAVHDDLVEMVRDDTMFGYACPVWGCNGFLSDELRAVMSGRAKADPQRVAFFSGFESDEITQEEFLKKHGPRDA